MFPYHNRNICFCQGLFYKKFQIFSFFCRQLQIALSAWKQSTLYPYKAAAKMKPSFSKFESPVRTFCHASIWHRGRLKPKWENIIFFIFPLSALMLNPCRQTQNTPHFLQIIFASYVYIRSFLLGFCGVHLSPITHSITQIPARLQQKHTVFFQCRSS